MPIAGESESASKAPATAFRPPQARKQGTGSGTSRQADSTVTINNNTYTAAQVGTLTGRIDYARKIEPYLGLGWGNLAPRHHGFVYNVDLGVLFTGSPQVSLNASNPGNNAQLTADVAAAQATAQNDASKVTLWPMIQIGLGYAF
ncbi:MAG: hypothetical protein ACYCXT_11120 [Acidiferrobacteraceae bacterium]